jgi:aminoglycoside 3-N-acetyltransferase
MIDDKKFNLFLDSLNINKGDILYISSDITKILYYFKKEKKIFKIEEFLQYFINRVGKNGTILIPTFSWDFCRYGLFDTLKTKSFTGAISNYALKRDDFIRTKHPMFSFAIYGKHAKKLSKIDCMTGWGNLSIFDYMYKKNAKNLIIGKDYKPIFTFMHYIEQKVKVNYRFFKNFKGKYINGQRIEKKVVYQMYARKENIFNTLVSTLSEKYDEIMIKKRCYNKCYFNNIYFGTINLKLAGDILEKDMRNEKKLLFLAKEN